jgi:hypothetical protein
MSWEKCLTACRLRIVVFYDRTLCGGANIFRRFSGLETSGFVARVCSQQPPPPWKPQNYHRCRLLVQVIAITIQHFDKLAIYYQKFKMSRPDRGIIQTQIQEFPDLRSSYVSAGPVQVEFCTSWNWVYIWSATHVYRGMSWSGSALNWELCIMHMGGQPVEGCVNVSISP